MKDKTYRRLLLSVVIICVVLTIAHAAYALYAYQNASITYFITKEWW